MRDRAMQRIAAAIADCCWMPHSSIKVDIETSMQFSAVNFSIDSNKSTVAAISFYRSFSYFIKYKMILYYTGDVG
jgi:hypothetical protein